MDLNNAVLALTATNVLTYQLIGSYAEHLLRFFYAISAYIVSRFEMLKTLRALLETISS